MVSEREAFGEKALGEVISRVVAGMAARHRRQVEPVGVEPEPFVDLVEEHQRADVGGTMLPSLWARSRWLRCAFSAGAIMP